MPSQKSKRSRKRRKPDSAPRAVPSSRRDERAVRAAETERRRRREQRRLGHEGERPEGPFGGLPVSEVAILLGIVAAVFGFLNGGGPALVVGLVVCALGVCEITAREHFSGYRSHTALLAALPAVLIEVGVVAIVGEPKQRAFLLVVVVPVFSVLFWLLRRQFIIARQARVARSARGSVPLS
ncbi:MAG TPA: hypothetical protein VHW04_06910 [Solirubrobacteraceae bacterium]|nr:hypothetical protein [Solirubrobacteraceae bacterium]